MEMIVVISIQLLAQGNEHFQLGMWARFPLKQSKLTYGHPALNGIVIYHTDMLYICWIRDPDNMRIWSYFFSKSYRVTTH